ncbi:MAG: hypothetical protein MZV63_20070 [Marinilabiliales bacterium]|nr:hypothetical protein [Marinilabiliales bacterium]
MSTGFILPAHTNHIVYVDTLDWAGWDLKTILVSSIGGSGDRHLPQYRHKADAGGFKAGVQCGLTTPW